MNTVKITTIDLGRTCGRSWRDESLFSEDLRQKVVQAVHQRGTSKSEAARLFGISLSSVKRYTTLASEGESLILPEREVEDHLKPMSSQESSLRKTYALGPPLPLKTDAASWRGSLKSALANLP